VDFKTRPGKNEVEGDIPNFIGQRAGGLIAAHGKGQPKARLNRRQQVGIPNDGIVTHLIATRRG
jgi:hypothetical protein